MMKISSQFINVSTRIRVFINIENSRFTKKNFHDDLAGSFINTSSLKKIQIFFFKINIFLFQIMIKNDCFLNRKKFINNKQYDIERIIISVQ